MMAYASSVTGQEVLHVLRMFASSSPTLDCLKRPADDADASAVCCDGQRTTSSSRVRPRRFLQYLRPQLRPANVEQDCPAVAEALSEAAENAENPEDYPRLLGRRRQPCQSQKPEQALEVPKETTLRGNDLQRPAMDTMQSTHVANDTALPTAGQSEEGKQAAADKNDVRQPEIEPSECFFLHARQMPPLDHRCKEAMSCLLDECDIQQVEAVLELQGPLSLMWFYIRERLHGFEVASTAWLPCEDVPEAKVCQLQFRMPLPADSPDSLKRLASIPSETATTVMVRLHSDKGMLLLNFETQTHDAPFGNNFWVADQFTFQQEAGGVRLRKFSGLRWTQALPWYAGIVGAVAESKAAASAITAGEAFARLLQEFVREMPPL